MRHLTPVLGLALLTAVNAQTLNDLPSCAEPCVSSIVSTTICDSTPDASCFCGPYHDTISDTLRSCAAVTCSSTDAVLTQSTLEQICAAYSPSAKPSPALTSIATGAGAGETSSPSGKSVSSLSTLSTSRTTSLISDQSSTAGTSAPAATESTSTSGGSESGSSSSLSYAEKITIGTTLGLGVPTTIATIWMCVRGWKKKKRP
ncbi:hypothetical protein BKA64DRAFT_669729, partial [Cadophora sp. MPI-SDFR-AT-0126]